MMLQPKMTAVINKKVMAQNIKRCMKTKGISRKELCNRLGFAYSTVTDWLNAEKYPRIDKIELMANFFGVNKSELIEPRCLSQRQKEPISAPFRKKNIRIPVLGRVAAGIPIEAIEDIIDYEELDTSLPQFRTGTFFGLVVRGHSMTPTRSSTRRYRQRRYCCRSCWQRRRNSKGSKKRDAGDYAHRS